jgi:uncharacterized protein YfaS (alpha-2-macroglobulin family)
MTILRTWALPLLLAAGAPAQERPEQEQGLRFRLGEGSGDQPARPPSVPPLASALSAAEVDKVLRRLSALPPADTQSFALRGRSLPPPRAGAVVQHDFPPLADARRPAAPTPRPLRVVRYAPEGSVPEAKHLGVTFSQPMVAIGTQEQLARETPPVKLVPQPEGRWRWLGSQTLVFEAAGRFPMATDYEVEIPAGVRSTAGVLLQEATRWSFQTPPPAVVAKHPPDGLPIRRDPLFFLSFDQRIEPAAVLATIRLQAGEVPSRLRLATAEEVADDAAVQRQVQNALPGRWLAFRPDASLPPDTRVTLSLGPGTPSAEGPTRTRERREWQLRTHGPLLVTTHGCGGPCRPGYSWRIELSNPIDAQAFRKEMIAVAPPLADMKVVVSGSQLSISGGSEGGRAYTVTLAAGISDVFGGMLRDERSVTFDVTRPPAVVRDEPPRLWMRAAFMVLDPAGPLRASLYSRGHASLNVQAYAVTPEDFLDLPPQTTEPRGRKVFERDVNVADPQRVSETWVDLAPALTDGVGNVLLVVKPALQPNAARAKPVGVRTWVQVTRLTLDAFSDDRTLFASVSSLRDGAPVPDAEVQLLPGGPKARVGTSGLASLSLGSSPARLLLARRGADVAFLPGGEGGSWQGKPAAPTLRWYVFDALSLYRPGETVKVKGWLRLVGGGASGDVTLPGASVRRVSYTLADAEGNEVAKGTRALDGTGGFDLSLPLPANMNLGETTLSLEADAGALAGARHEHTLAVLEFRRPEFEVKAEASEGPHRIAQSATLTVAASYFAGGALPDTPVRWDVRASPATFRPPQRADYVFGMWVPWWLSHSRATTTSERHEGRTDSLGRHRLRIDFDAVEPPQPMQIHAEATVEDVNRQELTARTELLVHPADVYVGLKMSRLFVWRDGPMSVDVIATDLDGGAVAGRPVEVRAEAFEREQEAGAWVEKLVDSQVCAVVSSNDAVRCEFTARAGGQYRITATVTDARGRMNRSVLSCWAGGFDRYDFSQSDVMLVPDKPQYAAGDVARILVVAPFAPAEGVLTLRRSGIARAERFHMAGRSHALEFKIEDAWTPNLHVQVDLTGTGGAATATASASLELPVPPLHRTLQVKLAPRDAVLAPGASTMLEAEVLDARSQPVSGGELAIVVLDEAILSLLGAFEALYEGRDDDDLPPWLLRDPLRAFYAKREAGGHDRRLRSSLVVPSEPRSGGGGTGSQTAGNITYDPVGCAVAGQFPLIEASLDPHDQVARARVYFKSALSPAFYYVEMVQSGDRFVGKLPKPKLESSPVTYYVMAIMTDGTESQTAEHPVQIVSDEAECPADLRVADRGGPGAAPVFSAATAAVAATAGFSAGGDVAEAIPLRADFKALALFAASVRTDARGRASVPLKLPDNLTRYRIRAVAADGSRFGRAESSLTARLPLMVRQSPPRFLNFGDRFELPVVIQNQTDAPLAVDVAVRTSNADLLEGGGRRVSVPANDRVEVRFPVAARRPGVARFQVGAVSGSRADASELQLPVWVPATTEAFATYGQIDEGAVAQPVSVPQGVVPEFGGLELSTSSTALQALTDAVLYLVAYPYECSEQLSSRILAIAALRDVLTAFKAEALPTPEAMEAAVKRDIARLQERQREDGSVGFWRADEIHPWPYMGVHVAHALQRAKDKGFDVPQEMLERSRRYLAQIEGHIPPWYGPHSRDGIEAYALYVRKLMGDRDPGRARAILANRGLDAHDMEAVGWLLPVLSGDAGSAAELAAIRRHIANRAVESAAAAHFTSDYGDDEYVVLHSERRVDAILLEGLIGDQPQSELIPKLVQGLLGQRKAGRWATTQECSFVLLALDRYFRAYEKATPDFVARAWLGPAYAGEQRFRGRSTDRQEVQVPMRALLQAGGAQELVVAKQGKGRLYYRVGLRYAPDTLRLEPADFGFQVERSYEPVDEAADVTRDASGAWHVKSGARVRVQLRLLTPQLRHHVALVDPLPAGLEPLNPELATTSSSADNRGDRADRWWRWDREWWEHQNMRDDRVEAFTSELRGGEYLYSYVARATTPGDFVAPPPRAEEMYHPETFGRGRTERVIVR